MTSAEMTKLVCGWPLSPCKFIIDRESCCALINVGKRAPILYLPCACVVTDAVHYSARQMHAFM